MKTMYDEHTKHELAMRLAKLLIKRDISWESTFSEADKGRISVIRDGNKTGEDKEVEKSEEEKNAKAKAEGGCSSTVTILPSESQKQKSSASETASPEKLDKPTPTSLLIATSTGIVEIANEILSVYPQAVEHVSNAGQNILHIAIKHRRLEIFRIVKKMGLPIMSRLARRIDNNGYTLLHHVGDIRHYTGGTLPGPTLQLQEELHWFEVRIYLLIKST